MSKASVKPAHHSCMLLYPWPLPPVELKQGGLPSHCPPLLLPKLSTLPPVSSSTGFDLGSETAGSDMPKEIKRCLEQRGIKASAETYAMVV